MADTEGPGGPSHRAADGLADHEVDTVEAVACLHRDHYRRASSLQRLIDSATERLGRPAAVVFLTVVIAGWAGLAAWRGGGRVDQPSFAWLELAATLAALLVAILILVTQRREDQLADRRAQLTLQLALLADKKSAKIIQLLEELRRDAPNIADRVDTESEDMAKPADPQVVAASIEEQAGGSGLGSPDSAGATPWERRQRP
ncbi:DUF1003 domain-containing protein [Caulobacter sp. DWR3-1-2]|uniref:DUF1003 domain-containing protein n=1 Tax=Caulobacter sp. DWR3-1-2 TaxID=2804647 RepID=UPI003CE7394C